MQIFRSYLSNGTHLAILLEHRRKQITIFHSNRLLQTFQSFSLKATTGPFKTLCGTKDIDNSDNSILDVKLTEKKTGFSSKVFFIVFTYQKVEIKGKDAPSATKK